MKSYRKKRTTRKQKNIVGTGLVNKFSKTVKDNSKNNDVDLPFTNGDTLFPPPPPQSEPLFPPPPPQSEPLFPPPPPQSEPLFPPTPPTIDNISNDITPKAVYKPIDNEQLKKDIKELKDNYDAYKNSKEENKEDVWDKGLIGDWDVKHITEMS